MSAPVLAGAEAWSHEGTLGTGVLTIHGFTGNPSSMRGMAEALAAAGFHIELPRLPGHGTTIDEMIPTRWDDWTAEVESAYQRLAARTDSIVVGGLSMGGSLTLWTGLEHPEVAGLVCVNPATVPPPPEIAEMVTEMLAEGLETLPGIGESDIADPDVVEIVVCGHAAARVAFADDRRADPDERALRRAEDAAAALHVPSGPHRRTRRQRVSRRPLRRHGGAHVARAQLPRGDAGLRPRLDLRRDGRVRQAVHDAKIVDRESSR